MSAVAIKFLLEKEIKKINKMIDGNIQMGRSYKKEARIHKILTGKLRHLKQARTNKTFSYLFM